MLGRLCGHLILSVSAKNTAPKEQLADAIRLSLEEVCRLWKWNYQSLIMALEFDLKDVLYHAGATEFHYLWNGRGDWFQYLSKALRTSGTIKDGKAFERLFQPMDTPLSVAFNESHRKLVTLLFHQLCEHKIIIPKGMKAGKFSTLNQSAYDFDGSVLFKSDPKHIMTTLKRDGLKNHADRRMYDGWVKKLGLSYSDFEMTLRNPKVEVGKGI